jgi:hypothetical protein
MMSTKIDYTKLTLEQLCKIGNLSLHNAGPNLIIIWFSTDRDDDFFRGEGADIPRAIANLKPAKSNKLKGT